MDFSQQMIAAIAIYRSSLWYFSSLQCFSCIRYPELVPVDYYLFYHHHCSVPIDAFRFRYPGIDSCQDWEHYSKSWCAKQYLAAQEKELCLHCQALIEYG